MKRLWALVALVALLTPAVALAGGEYAAVSEQKLKKGQARVELAIQGMTCGGCCAKVETAVRGLDGVVDVKADYEKGSATVVYQKKKVDVDAIVATINEKTSFKAKAPKKSAT